jgi:hypothetical protein
VHHRSGGYGSVSLLRRSDVCLTLLMLLQKPIGILTERTAWRYSIYVNLTFAKLLECCPGLHC